MPFKGDGRLGGQRRNDSTLNGMSEGPSYPAAGTVLSTLSNVEYTLGLEYSYTYTSEGTEYTITGRSQRCSVNVVADGSGSDYLDFANAFNIQYYPYGHLIIGGISAVTSYVNVGGTDYPNGYTTQFVGHDGYGGASVMSGSTVYDATGVFREEGADVNANYGGSTFHVGNGTRRYSHNGSGGYTESVDFVSYFSNGTQVGTYYYGTSVTLPSGNSYSSGSFYNYVYSNGTGGVYTEGGGGTYASYGDYIANEDATDYYHNGYGGYYTSSSNGGGGTYYPSAGTTTGNTSNGTNYIYINGNQYSNGDYYSTEYHDGSGGTYWSTTYNYLSYGYNFFSETWYDEWGNGYNTNYNSDGQGGYYTSS